MADYDSIAPGASLKRWPALPSEAPHPFKPKAGEDRATALCESCGKTLRDAVGHWRKA